MLASTPTRRAIDEGAVTRADWSLEVTEAVVGALSGRVQPLRVQFFGLSPGVSLTIDAVSLVEGGAARSTGFARPSTVDADGPSTLIGFDPDAGPLPSFEARSTIVIEGRVSIEPDARVPSTDVTVAATLAPDGTGSAPGLRLPRFATDLRPPAGVTIIDVFAVTGLEITGLPDVVAGVEARGFGVRVTAAPSTPLNGTVLGRVRAGAESGRSASSRRGWDSRPDCPPRRSPSAPAARRSRTCPI